VQRWLDGWIVFPQYEHGRISTLSAAVGSVVGDSSAMTLAASLRGSR
jgi:hypothetical protein